MAREAVMQDALLPGDIHGCARSSGVHSDNRANYVAGLGETRMAHYNLAVPKLIEVAVARGEGMLTSTGAFNVVGGRYTGRSPEDRFVVDESEVRDRVWWGPVNKPFPEDAFDRLRHRVASYLRDREVFVFDGFAGADPEYRLPIRIITELAWQNAFAQQVFLRPTPDELRGHEQEFTVIAAPGFKAVPERDGTRSEAFILISFSHRLVLIGGTYYAGEIKKSVFSVMNFLLPERGVFPMHCSANIGPTGDVALFFGLSGTGKTTLSADPGRRLIGDDEHGWSDKGVFNFEGGCYAKCIRLSKESEPLIYEAIRFGALLENVVVDPETRQPDFDSDALTENTRAGFPVSFIPGSVPTGLGGHPSAVIFLTADAFGILPPVAKLTREQAMYHFLSGYTSKLAGTERGVTTPQATFSTCFAAPFLPRPPVIYSRLLGRKIEAHKVPVYLVNTGWIGGPYGVGKRIAIRDTRAIVSAILDGTLDKIPSAPDPVFGIAVPEACAGVPSEIMRPRATWSDAQAYDEQAAALARKFVENFRRFEDASDAVKAAGPRLP
ncbi:MAG: phosphoenolpyruvate carboxykinase (ATP) [Bacillota bacterium]